MHSDFLKIILSFFIAAFGIPSLSGFLSMAAAAGGYALFWSSAVSLKKNKFWVSVVWFAGVQAVQLNWMISMQYMGPGILLVYLFVIFGLGIQFGFLTHFLRLPLTWRQIFGLSGFWVLMEWVRVFFLSGFLWNPIGLALAANGYSIQMASLFGVYGLCFWLIFTNLALLKRSKCWLLLALLPYGYGIVHQYILKGSISAGKELSVALVQTALLPEQRDFFRGKPDEYIHPLMQWDLILSHLEKTGKERFDLIVLSEGAIPNGPWGCIYPYDAAVAIWQLHFGKESMVDFPPNAPPFVAGKRVSNAFWIQALSNHFYAEVVAGLEDREAGRVYNAAFHFCPQKTGFDRYQKQILIPMGEYIPFNQWKWLVDLSAETFEIKDTFSPGTESKIFEGAVPMGVFICLEETYGQLIRDIRRKGATLFLNLTNDVWFPETRLPWHHFDHGRLRSVENGVCLLRATNTGVTAAVDCFGETLALFPPSEKEAGALVVNFANHSYCTLYTFFGDVPILVFSGICSLLSSIYRRASRPTRKKKLL
jgi:apolipoprotein N-acyltransferase